MTWLGIIFNLLAEVAPYLGMSGGSGPPSIAQRIEAAHWKQRVVLVTAPTPSSKYPAYAKQKQLLAAADAGLRERHVVVLCYPHGEIFPNDENYLRKRYDLSFKSFEVLLIGKDGGVKLRSTHPLTSAALFATIDQMPMRREEMRRAR